MKENHLTSRKPISKQKRKESTGNLENICLVNSQMIPLKETSIRRNDITKLDTDYISWYKNSSILFFPLPVSENLNAQVSSQEVYNNARLKENKG